MMRYIYSFCFHNLFDSIYQAEMQDLVYQMGIVGMLTYIVGLTEMSVGKFIRISTIARIPSILSSVMIGSTMRQGNWEISLFMFLITGIVGISGIALKDKIYEFCHKLTKQKCQDIKKAECLDFVETIHRNRVYPIIYCRIQMDGNLDCNRLISAVDLSREYVPEVLYSYDFRRGCFVNRDLSADDTVSFMNHNMEFNFRWDLSKDTQLKIFITKEEFKTTITFGMSHILADGEGFLQYLYLLASLYNGDKPNKQIQNIRKSSIILKDIIVKPSTEQTKNNKKFVMSPLRGDSKDTRHFCLNSRINKVDFEAIYTKAKKRGVTLNDVFMAAYARVIARLQNTDKVVLPCPADLRRFQKPLDSYTIANMTGIYRIVVEKLHLHTFDEILDQIHIEMLLQKSRYHCFAGIQLLNFCYHKVPKPLLNKIVERSYELSPISYTNIGVIDNKKLQFQDSNIKYCYLTGMYRLSPDFQLSISTFQNVCTLNCTLIGDAETKRIGFHIIEQVKSELLKWAQE